MFRITLKNPLDLIARGQNSAISKSLNSMLDNNEHVSSLINDMFFEGSVNVRTIDEFKSALKGLISYGWCYKAFPYYGELIRVTDGGDEIKTHNFNELLEAFRGQALPNATDEWINDNIGGFQIEINYGDSDARWYGFTDDLKSGISYNTLKADVISAEWPVDIQNSLIDCLDNAHDQWLNLPKSNELVTVDLSDFKF